MLHLYYFIRDYIIFRRTQCRHRIIQRIPKVKILGIHDFGLSLGIVLIFVAMAFWHTSLGELTSLAIFGFFIILTWLSGWLLALLCFVLAIIFLFTGGALGPNFWSSIKQISAWYMAGYIGGFIFALTYNECLYLSLKLVHCCKKNIFAAVYAYREEEDINILKSPIIDEEVDIPESRFYRKLYQFEKLPAGTDYNPYTIAFIANPFYKYQRSANIEDYEVRVDPILNNLDLFLHTIDRALMSFENDQVLGRPEIWSKVRIVAIFPTDFEKKISSHRREHYTLAGRIPEQVQFDESIYQDLLAVDENFDENFQNILELLDGNEIFVLNRGEEDWSQIDVVYILSSNLDYTRSTALFSDAQVNNPGAGDPFRVKLFDGSLIDKKHEYYVKSPGKVALNLLTARQKTFIHEFGHAMSHFENGAIVDEYFNEYLLVSRVIENIPNLLLSYENDQEMTNELAIIRGHMDSYRRNYKPTLFMINKSSKRSKTDPVPKNFMDYNQISYHSDRDHPSAEENWLHFFPLRESLNIGCTMDRTIGQFKYDKLISDFMYDRLITKINRK